MRTRLALLLKIIRSIGQPFFYLLLASTIIAAFIISSLIYFLSWIRWFKKIISLTWTGVLWWLKLPLRIWRAIYKSLLNYISKKHKIAQPFSIVLRQKRYFIIFSLFAVVLLIAKSEILNGLPNPNNLITRNQEFSTKIYDRKGRLLFKFYKNKNRTYIKLSQIPLHVIQATLAIEDAEFYRHQGFSIKGIVRALLQNLSHGDISSGGSTITQQLVKNALLSPEKTFSRKIKEIITAVRVEAKFPKDQILEMYLNEVPYGGSAYGIEEASQTYFGKSAKDLTLAEGALLAGLPKAPTLYSPFINPHLARARQLEVLSRMVQEGFITKEAMEEATSQKIILAPKKINIKAPHFVMYIRQILAQKYGEEMVEQGGLEVTTTLDLDIQQMAEKIVREELAKVKNLRITNGAVLVTKPSTGEILAMVGSKDYFDTSIDGQFNATTALRQPGSAIKPINYTYALESQKYTPATIISDSPITYWIPGSEPYSPRNYDGRFHGLVSLRVAFASSLNVPAVKVLASYGVSKMVEEAKKLGITTWEDPSRFGLSLTLGGGEVKMVDMAVVYATLANYGVRQDLNPILAIKDYKGKILEESKCIKKPSIFVFLPIQAYAAEAAPVEECGKRVLDERVAFIITNILSDNSARSLAFGPNSLLNIPGHPEVAVKTGTTQNLRDNWAIGYTKDYVVVVWVGNNDNTPMSYVASGITGATPIWHRIIRNLLKDKPSYKWGVPAGIVQTEICTITGTLPCQGCPVRTEYFLEGTQPQKSCNLEEYFRKLEEKKKSQIKPEILSF